MNYVLLIYSAESRYGAMSKAEGEAFMQSYVKYSNDFYANPRAGDCAPLEPTSTATSVQVRDGKRIVKDGPFAETREQLGGYYSLDAETDEEAFAWAERIPDATAGSIEVRPIARVQTAPQSAPSKTAKSYLLLIYGAEAALSERSDAEKQATSARYDAFTKSLEDAGQFLAGAQLDTVKKARCVSVNGGKRIVRDGPFAETREQLGGYYRITARDLDEAIALAARIPAAETGTIEVRPLMDVSAYF
jgi:hypothetical protein